MLFFLLFLAGVASGFIGGMGMGGGTLLIPMLTIFFKIPQAQAGGINLLSFVPMAIVAAVLHAKNGYINVKAVLPVAVSAVAFSVAGSLIVRLLQGDLQTKLFGGFLTLIAAWQLFLLLKTNE